MPRRSRLDAELVRRGLARSREHAVALIAEGCVAVSGRAATKPATGVEAGTLAVVLNWFTFGLPSTKSHKNFEKPGPCSMISR